MHTPSQYASRTCSRLRLLPNHVAHNIAFNLETIGSFLRGRMMDLLTDDDLAVHRENCRHVLANMQTEGGRPISRKDRSRRIIGQTGELLLQAAIRCLLRQDDNVLPEVSQLEMFPGEIIELGGGYTLSNDTRPHNCWLKGEWKRNFGESVFTKREMDSVVLIGGNHFVLFDVTTDCNEFSAKNTVDGFLAQCRRDLFELFNEARGKQGYLLERINVLLTDHPRITPREQREVLPGVYSAKLPLRPETYDIAKIYWID